MKMINLYKELLDILSFHNKDITDIAWVECGNYGDKYPYQTVRIPFKNFVEAASNTNYNEDAWFTHIPPSLRIYGKDRKFLIYVHDYDGNKNLTYIDMEAEPPTLIKEVASLTTKLYDDSPVWKD